MNKSKLAEHIAEAKKYNYQTTIYSCKCGRRLKVENDDGSLKIKCCGENMKAKVDNEKE